MAWPIFERLFNLPPTKDANFITDKHGEKFWVYWRDKFESAAELNVLYRSRWAGVIKLLREEGGSLLLADIIIYGHRKLRGRGLGKAMMQELIRWAKENRYKEIWGFIIPDDETSIEYLQEWYYRQGFNVDEVSPGKYQILLELSPESR